MVGYEIRSMATYNPARHVGIDGVLEASKDPGECLSFTIMEQNMG